MREINILSWGGGTQSTAMLLMSLKNEIKDENKQPVKMDYIIFSDTGDESKMTYDQIYKVQKYIEDTYNAKIIITKKNKELITDGEVIKMFPDGKGFGTSKYADLYQEHKLFYMGKLKWAHLAPHWIRNKETGKVAPMLGKNCTIHYKINQLIREIRQQENIKQILKNKLKLNMYIGFTVDEISRVKPSPTAYIENKFPLVDMNLSKIDCVNYVLKELGFKPVSSVCNMCYANSFDTVYNIYKNDENGWKRMIELDEVMRNKPDGHKIFDDVFMYRWQAVENVRLKDIDMEEYKEKYREKNHQMSIFELEEEQMACMGGCFI